MRGGLLRRIGEDHDTRHYWHLARGDDIDLSWKDADGCRSKDKDPTVMARLVRNYWPRATQAGHKQLRRSNEKADVEDRNVPEL